MSNNIPVEKNKEYIVDIIDNGYEGEGIAKIDNYTIFIPNAIKNEKAKILIVKVNSTHAFGKIVELIEKSPSRQECDCSTYKRCGGCNLRHIKYEDTLKLKQNTVQNLVNKTLNNKIQVKETIGMEHPYEYRNKAQYPIGYNSKNEIVFGVYANRTHDIIPIEKCSIQKQISVQITEYIVEFMKRNGITAYNEKTGQGLVRHIVIKVGIYTNEIMCVIVINGKELPMQEKLSQKLIKRFKNIKTIVKNINTKNTNVIMGQENINIYGDGYIYDILGDYKFKISPLSFYQINPVQAEKLYNKAIELANIKKEDMVFDLYCGIGTIGIFLAKYAKKVYGIEIVNEAINDAKENAKINNVNNIEFICGDVMTAFDKLIKQNNIIPDIIFVDPPRRGLDKVSIENMIKVKSRKIVYISCNPATLVRDLKMLEDVYSVESIQPLDMFPFSSHVECVAVLQLEQDM